MLSSRERKIVNGNAVLTFVTASHRIRLAGTAEQGDPSLKESRAIIVRTEHSTMATASVRYIVNDVDVAIEFYTRLLGFAEVMHPAPTFAMLSRGGLRLVLSAPGGGPGGGQAMPDGTLPQPGGWNRFQLQIVNLESTVAELRASGARFRNEVVIGVGGKQILVEDPSGNLVELFEPTLLEAALEERGRAT